MCVLCCGVALSLQVLGSRCRIAVNERVVNAHASRLSACARRYGRQDVVQLSLPTSTEGAGFRHLGLCQWRKSSEKDF